MKVFLGLFWLLMLLSFCFAAVFATKYVLHKKHRKPPPEPPPSPPPEPVYYIVERKARKKNVYSAPKKIKFE